MHAEAFARRAKRLLSGLPTNFDEQLKQTPYRALGVACAVGVGVGILLGFRILRTTLAGVASAAIVELVRTYLLHEEDGEQVGAHSGESAAARSS